jgi:hypothetical protein
MRNLAGSWITRDWAEAARLQQETFEIQGRKLGAKDIGLLGRIYSGRPTPVGLPLKAAAPASTKVKSRSKSVIRCLL